MSTENLENFTEIFSRRLKKARLDRNLSQEELAALLEAVINQEPDGTWLVAVKVDGLKRLRRPDPAARRRGDEAVGRHLLAAGHSPVKAGRGSAEPGSKVHGSTESRPTTPRLRASAVIKN
jgi:hypothetical protein